jgi:cytochrome c oxidase cbb3-type subunit 3
MRIETRLIAAMVFAGASMTGLVFAQDAGAPPPQNQPAGQAPAGQTPAAPAGRGAGQRGQAAGQGGQRGGRRGGFTQFTREIAPQDVLVRGKSLYEANCASCHASDLRGSATGVSLMRSGVVLSDQHGELVAAAVSKHTPALTLVSADTTAIAEYLHSILATTGPQGSPPGRNPTGIELNVLVGDAKAGETAFAAGCASCHSIGGDLKGIGSKYRDVRTLQNAWVSGSSSIVGGGGRGGGNGTGDPATVTLADGTTLQGTLVRQDDFLVILSLADGTRKSMTRAAVTKVDVKDPHEPHKKMVLELDDPQNKKMHDITAYLWSIK